MSSLFLAYQCAPPKPQEQQQRDSLSEKKTDSHRSNNNDNRNLLGAASGKFDDDDDFNLNSFNSNNSQSVNNSNTIKDNNKDTQQLPLPLVHSFCHIDLILAIAFSDGKIYFFGEEGQRIPDLEIYHNASHRVTCMEWQKHSKSLAIGFEDGSVNCWVIQATNKIAYVASDSKVHKSVITFLLWNEQGSRLISGDKGGVLCVWKADSRGNLTPSIQYKKSSALTKACFCASMSINKTITSMNMNNNNKDNNNKNNKNNMMMGMGMNSGGGGGRKDLLSKGLMSPSFFFGTENGLVSYADDLGHCSDVQSLATSIDCMMFFEEKMRLVIITRSLHLTQLQVFDDGHVTPVMKVKLSVAGSAAEKGINQVSWAGPGLLVTASNESLIRFWDLANDENYVLTLSSTGMGLNKSDVCTSVSFNPLQRYLAVGTREGKCIMWGFRGEYSKPGQPILPSSQIDWEVINPTDLNTCIKDLSWGPGLGSVGVNAGKYFYLLDETQMRRMYTDGVAIIQTKNDCVQVHDCDSANLIANNYYYINTDLNIKGMAFDRNNIIFWNGKKAQVYELRVGSAYLLSTFHTTTQSAAIREDNIYKCENGKIDIVNFSNINKGSISFTEGEGKPEFIDINGRYMATTTDKGLIKIMQIDGRNPKHLGSAGRFVDAKTTQPLGAIRSIKLNCDGTKLSILSDIVHGSLKIREPDTRLHIYDMDRDTVVHYDFGGQSRFPNSHYWDPDEPKLLALEVKRIKGTSTTRKKTQEKKITEESKLEDPKDVEREKIPDTEIVTLLVTADNGVLMQDSFPLNPNDDTLLGIATPRFFFSSFIHSDEDSINTHMRPTVRPRTMRDFIGLEDVEDNTRKALLDFSYFLTVGNMDEAYRAVKLIKNPSVWQNMAHMCVKTKRLDVAEICLGNMGHARGAAAVRMAKKEPELEASIAALAVQLGLVDDAVRLYKECGRHDLLNKLYQQAGLWDRALYTAKHYDRIHLKVTHHKYAKHLEKLGDSSGAIRHYELAETHRVEIPRMLTEQKRFDELEDYILRSGDPELLKWFAKYCESLGNFDKARKYYKRAQDYVNLVRIYCKNNDFESAQEIVHEVKDPSAAYHLAREYEAQGDVNQAINCFAKSGCYNHAITLAKMHGFDTDLMSFALKARESLMIDVAGYFEEKHQYDKAVQLYQKGGDVAKALDLCFKAGSEGRTEMFDVLKNIAENLGQDTSPQVLARCADFFIEHGQFEKAVRLLIAGKKYSEAIVMCVENKVKITEEMSEKLTPENVKNATKEKTEEGKEAHLRVDNRKNILRELAAACKKQGSYHLACQKYTEAGERLKAIKCLLKSGDTKKIKEFAQISRNREIYILTANYMQNLDWHSNPDIHKAIVQFYSKAKAFEQLSVFYDACAQVEIDEYRDYEKALGALREAVKFMEKAKASSNQEEMLRSLQQRIMLVDRYVQAKNLIKTDPQEMVTICRDLLSQPGLEQSIRVGDCFALLIEYYYSKENFREAFNLIEDMRERRIILNPYLEADVIKEIHRAVGVPLESENSKNQDSEDEDDIIEDDGIGENMSHAMEEELDESMGSDDIQDSKNNYK